MHIVKLLQSSAQQLPARHLLASLLLVFSLLPFGHSQAQQPSTVPLFRVQSVTVPQWLELSAQVEAVAQGTVSAQTSGRIVELPFDVNDLVPQGAVIVRFTDTEQQARLRQAQAAVRETQSRFDEQQKELVRVRDIHSKGLVAKAALDLAQANYNSAKARLDQATAAAAEANEQLEQTVVRAPYSGILQQRFVELGELAVPGKPLLRGLSLEQLRLVAQLPQSQYQAVRQSPAAELVLADGRALAIPAPKLTIAPQANPQSHSFLLRLQLPAADYSQYALLPGNWLRLRLQTGQANQLQIPQTAVIWRGEVSSVYLQAANGGAPMLQPVRVQPQPRLVSVADSPDVAATASTTSGPAHYQVLSGLTAGQQIVIDASAHLATLAATATGG
jgi:RND family efflux transporter MFP subunit